ncbi:MAG: nickel-responsive transcriptional regulator NikR [Panacagrimonas sp.]
MRRFTISIDDDLADAFDAWAHRHRYQQRSEAFRDLLRAQIEQERFEFQEADHCVAALSFVYNHHERDLASRLTSGQHEHHGLVMATLHVHLDHDHCLETVLLRGRTDRVGSYAQSVIAERGVRHGRVHQIPVDIEDSDHRGQEHSHTHLHPRT